MTKKQLTAKRYYRAHRKKLLAGASVYYKKNRAHCLARTRAWAKTHPAAVAKINRRYMKRHRAQFNKIRRVYYASHKDTIRAIDRKRRYGISRAEFDALKAKQKGRCAMCPAELSKPYVDHDHTTQKVRGLLCQPCNNLLGFAQDNEAILFMAIRYLRKWRKNAKP